MAAVVLRRVIRWSVVIVIAVHGLLHLLGVVKGFGWADVPALSAEIGPWLGLAWLVASVLVLAVALLLARGTCPWWLPLVAAVVSEAVIVTAWQDAWAGTVANLLLLAVAVHAWARTGPRSLRTEYARHVRSVLARARTQSVLTEGDLAGLPEPVARHVRRTGALGRPAVIGFRAEIHGRIRGGPSKPWMRFTGEQVNLYGPDPCRLFFMDATMFGLPVDVLHVFDRRRATMRVRLCSLVPIVRGTGPEMDRAETVTLLNDLCLLVPEALVRAPIRWASDGDRTATGSFTLGAHTVAADLLFDAEGDLADFVSDDRLRASTDGRTFTRQRWSTPVRAVGQWDGRRACSVGEARWHAPGPEGTFTYLEFVVDDLSPIEGVPWARAAAPTTRSVGSSTPG